MADQDQLEANRAGEPEDRHAGPGLPPAPRPSTRTRGFLFADLRGYTDFVERHGDHAAADLLATYRALVRDAVARFAGAEIKTEGDSFYVVFDSASAAVGCGLAIVEAARAAREADPERPIRVGVGIHAGETVETTEGFVGSAVNIAARVCAVAGAQEVVVTDTVRSLTRTFLDVGFAPLGPRPLKGVGEPIPLYRIDAGGARAVPPVVAPPRHTRRLAIGGFVAATAVVAVAAGAILGTGVLPPAASPSTAVSAAASPPRTSSTSPQSSASLAAPSTSGAPTIASADADLLSILPANVNLGSNCRPSPVAERTLTPQASIRCDFAVGGGASTVWFERMESASTFDYAWSTVAERHRLGKADCATTAEAIDIWKAGEVFSGRLLCYRDERGSWVLWTYDASHIVARATRPDANHAALYRWWRGVAPFLLG